MHVCTCFDEMGIEKLEVRMSRICHHKYGMHMI